jgi:non-heme chloroperoxidase
MYEYQLTRLPGYGFRCIAIDLRGYGKSDHPWERYSYDRLSDDIRIVMDALQLHDVSLIGFSMGGAIAIRYMSRHTGHRVSRLALLGAAAPSFTKREGYPFGTTKEEVNSLIAASLKDRPSMLELFGQKFFASQISPAFRDWFHQLGIEASPHGTVKGLEMLRDEDLRPDLAAVRVPTAIFHGVLDQICPFEFARLMHQGIAGSILVPFEHSGHGLFYDELDKMNHELLLFLNQVSYRIGNS